MELKYFDKAYMEAQKAYSAGEVPVGAVIVKNGKILSSAHNRKEMDKCCTSHAEMLAIKKACKKLGNWRLDGCDIYVTLDPCPMCASAIKQARISNVFSGLNNKDLNNDDIIREIFKTDRVNPGVTFESNLFVEKAKKILSDFFKEKRKKC